MQLQWLSYVWGIEKRSDFRELTKSSTLYFLRAFSKIFGAIHLGLFTHSAETS